MKSNWATFLLEAVFTAVYFLILFSIIKWVFARTPVNFAFDLLSIACVIVAFVASVGLVERTVQKIKEHL